MLFSSQLLFASLRSPSTCISLFYLHFSAACALCSLRRLRLFFYYTYAKGTSALICSEKYTHIYWVCVQPILDHSTICVENESSFLSPLDTFCFSFESAWLMIFRFFFVFVFFVAILASLFAQAIREEERFEGILFRVRILQCVFFLYALGKWCFPLSPFHYIAQQLFPFSFFCTAIFCHFICLFVSFVCIYIFAETKKNCSNLISFIISSSFWVLF